MPKGRRTCNLGAQRRTVVLPCGKQFVGPPDRLDIACRMHRKKCETCKHRNLGGRIGDIAFDSEMNKTVDIRGNISTAKIGAAYRNGERVAEIPLAPVEAGSMMQPEPELEGPQIPTKLCINCKQTYSPKYATMQDALMHEGPGSIYSEQHLSGICCDKCWDQVTRPDDY
jgi:hypothetical protein